MLIKKNKVAKIIKMHSTASLLEESSTASELTKAAELKLQKTHEEAKKIKMEAEAIILAAQNKLKEAETNAANIIKSAKEDAEKIKERTYQETLKKAGEEAEALRTEAKILLKELFNVKREVLFQAHKQIINIALDLAEKILKHQAAVNPETLKTQVVEAIKKATAEADRVQVFVNPSDLTKLQSSTSEIKNLFPTGIEIVVLGDDSVDSGSCIVETKSGRLDARFSTQLATLTKLVSQLETIEPNIPLEDKEIIIKEPVPQAEAKATEEEIKLEEPLQILEEELPKNTPDATEIDELERQKLTEELLSSESTIEKPPEPLLGFPDEEETFPFSPKEEVINKVKEQAAEQVAEEAPPEESQPQEENKLVLLEEEEEEEEKEIDISSILRKKKKGTNGISKLASEVEKDPEWKEVIEEDE